MKSDFILVLCILCFCFLGHSQIYESKWIEKETEKTLLQIDEKNGAHYITLWGIDYEIHGEFPDLFISYHNEKLPLTIDYKNQTLHFQGKDYVAFPSSRKGQFSGLWKSQEEDIKFIIRIDENNDLTWEVVDPSNKGTKFWPKPTEKGFYYTLDHIKYSYIVHEDIMIDNQGNRYKRISEF